MSAVRVPDILLRVSPKNLERYQSLAVAGAGRGRVAPLPQTFSRADASTCATYIDRDGLIRKAAANILRISWVDLDGDGVRETPTIRLEGSRTNGWTHSKDMNDASWLLNQVTVGGTNALAPDGTATACWFLETVANAGHTVFRAPPSMTNNTQQSASFFVRGGFGRSWCRLRSINKAGTTLDSWINVDSGTLGTVAAGHTIIIGKPFFNSFVRVTVIFDAGTGAGSPFVEVGPSSADNVTGYAGDTSKALYIWGGMFETDKAFPSSWIDTTTAAVTRAADSLTVPFNFGPMDLTVLARVARPDYVDLTTTLPASPHMASLANNTAPALQLRFGSGSGARPIVSTIDTATTDAQQTQTAPAGAELATAFQYRAFTTGGMTRLDSGAGFTSEAGPATAFSAFGSQTLRLGGTGIAGDELYGDLIDLIIVRGLFTRAEMLAIP